MGKMPLFRNCKLDELFDLAHNADQLHTNKGDTIVQTGKPGAGLGLLLRGEASLMLENAASGTRTRLEKLKPGSLFGEVGLLLGSGNPHSVVAEADCDSLLIDPGQFEKTMLENPEVSLSLARKISSRMVQATFLGSANVEQAPPPQVQKAPPEQPHQPRGAVKPSDVIPWDETANYNLTGEVVGMIPPKLIRKHRMLPLHVSDQVLTVGMVNPRSVEAKQELRRMLQTTDPEVVAISEDDYNSTVARLNLGGGKQPRARGGARAGQITYAVDVDKEAQKKKAIIGNEVIKLFDQIVLEALDLGASDIHIEPGSVGVKVRYRTEGSLVERKEVISPTYAGPIVGRIKVLAELNITERHKPQDGRIVAQFGNRDLNLRVTTMAVARGEKAVIRIIDPSDVMRPLRQIFIDPRLEDAVHEALAQPYGAGIVAGPTGSGKSSTLYSMINERRATRPDTSIVTVEDPVEFLLPDVTQVSVLPRFGFGFATALYGLMRQDPDVIMIGELRDAETASIMVEAALTGHLVLTSIHGNNVAAVIQRLQHLGTDPILLSQALAIIIVQRLSKRLCPNCVQEGTISSALMNNLVARGIVSSATSRLPRPVGCDGCGKTGYLGRVAVQEVLHVDDQIRKSIAGGVAPEELLRVAKKQKRFISFAQSAAYHMARRTISPSDALLLVTD